MRRQQSFDNNDKKQQQKPPQQQPKKEHKYKPITLVNENQILYKQSLETNILTIVTGPAGTGKTYLACVHAAELLKAGDIDRIVLIRPYVDLNNRGIGFLKGGEEEKLWPYALPMIEAIKVVLGSELFDEYLESGKIQIKALSSIRGMSYNKSFLIADEMQGTVPNEIQALTTRIGKDSKLVIVGDTRQTDVKKTKENGLVYLKRIVETHPIRKTGVIEMTIKDVVRSGIVKDFVLAYEKEGWE